MKINVQKSTKRKFTALEAGTVLYVTSTYHGVEDATLMVVNMNNGSGFSLLNLETGMKWDVINNGRIEAKIFEDSLVTVINDLHESGKYTFTKVNAEMNVEI